MKDRAFLIRDVLGLDFASTGLKAVRVKAGTDKVSVVDAEVIPFDIEGGDAEASDRRESRPFSIPKRLQARSVALTCTAKDALVKMLTINGSTGPGTDARIFKEMALENAKNYRLAYKVTQRERTGFTVVAAAFSESLADKLLGFFSSGIPAPVTLEISGFSAMTAFLRGAGRSFAEDSIGVVDFGYTTTTL